MADPDSGWGSRPGWSYCSNLWGSKYNCRHCRDRWRFMATSTVEGPFIWTRSYLGLTRHDIWRHQWDGCNHSTTMPQENGSIYRRVPPGPGVMTVPLQETAHQGGVTGNRSTTVAVYQTGAITSTVIRKGSLHSQAGRWFSSLQGLWRPVGYELLTSLKIESSACWTISAIWVGEWEEKFY